MTEYLVDRVYFSYYSIEQFKYILRGIAKNINDIYYQFDIDNYNTIERNSVLLNKQIFSLGKCIRIFLKKQLTQQNFGEIYTLRDDLRDMTGCIELMITFLYDKNKNIKMIEFERGISNLREHKFYIENLINTLDILEEKIYGLR